MASDKRKVVIGVALLLISTAVILAIGGQIGTAIPIVAATLATLGLAAGAYLLGTAGEGRPV